MSKLWDWFVKFFKKGWPFLLSFLGIASEGGMVLFFARLGVKFFLIATVVTLLTSNISKLVASWQGIDSQLWAFFLSLLPSHVGLDFSLLFSSQVLMLSLRYRLSALKNVPDGLSTFQKFLKLRKK